MLESERQDNVHTFHVGLSECNIIFPPRMARSDDEKLFYCKIMSQTSLHRSGALQHEGSKRFCRETKCQSSVRMA